MLLFEKFCLFDVVYSLTCIITSPFQFVGFNSQLYEHLALVAAWSHGVRLVNLKYIEVSLMKVLCCGIRWCHLKNIMPYQYYCKIYYNIL